MTSDEKIIEHLDQIIQSCRDVKEDDRIHKDAKSLASFVIRDCNLLKQKIDLEYFKMVTP